MVPFSYSVLCRALDARTYRPKESIPADEESKLTNAKTAWAQIIHYLVSCGYLEWTERPMSTFTGHHSPETDIDSNEEMERTSSDSTVESDRTPTEESYDLPSSSDAGENEDISALFNPRSEYHSLHSLEDKVRDCIPHTRYRAPVFYVLNFAACVLSLCVQHRCALGSSPIRILPLAAALVEDIREFFGPRVANVATQLFKQIIHCAEHFPALFKKSWLTFDLDRYDWIHSPARDILRAPQPKAQGILFSTAPENWLLTEENRLSGINDPGNTAQHQSQDGEEHDSSSDSEDYENDEDHSEGEDERHDAGDDDEEKQGPSSNANEADESADEIDNSKASTEPIAKKRHASASTSTIKRRKLSKEDWMNTADDPDSDDQQKDEQEDDTEEHANQLSGKDHTLSLPSQHTSLPITAQTGIKLKIKIPAAGRGAKAKSKFPQTAAVQQNDTNNRNPNSKHTKTVTPSTRATRSSAKRVVPEDALVTHPAKRSRRR